jgi:hypothetical protein
MARLRSAFAYWIFTSFSFASRFLITWRSTTAGTSSRSAKRSAGLVRMVLGFARRSADSLRQIERGSPKTFAVQLPICFRAICAVGGSSCPCSATLVDVRGQTC